MFGAEAAAITQGHPLGYIPAAALVHIVNMLIYEKNISILEAVLDAKSAIKRIFKEKVLKYKIKDLDKFRMAFFTVIDTGTQNSFILLDKDDYLFLQNASSDTNNCSKMILGYSIFPAIILTFWNKRTFRIVF